jgi:hypothetical protein
MSKLFFLSAVATVLFSCSSNNSEQKTVETKTIHESYKDGNLSLNSLNSKSVSGICIKNFIADTAANEKEQGIRATFTLEIQQAILKQIQTDGFDALLADIRCKGTSGKEFSYVKTYLPKLSGMVVYPDKHNVFTHETIRELHMDIPFRKLELNAGIQELTISIDIYPIRFQADSNRVETKHIERIGSNPLFTQSYSCTVQSPKLKINTLSISGITIKTENKKASTYDFTLTGTGFPDPYWQVLCGEELLFFSPSSKNTLTVTGTHSSNQFYTCPKDVISIKFLDYDNGPFNRDDLIETIEGTSAELKALKKYNGSTVMVSTIKVDSH